MKGATPTPNPGIPLQATIHGFWGFDPFTGPIVALQQTPATNWRIIEDAKTPLIAGQPNHLQLLSTGTACIRTIALEPANAKVDWKLATLPPSSTPTIQPVDLTLNLQQAATPGTLQLAIQQFGSATPDHIGTRTFAQPAHLEALHLHAGDATAELTGTSLDQVKSLSLRDHTYLPACLVAESPGAPSQAASSPEMGCTPSTLALSLPPNIKPQPLKPNEKLTATILLQDGRTLDLPFTVLPPRPAVTILSSRITQPNPSPIQLATPTDLPLGATLTVLLKSQTPFPRAQQIEIANSDASLHTTLSVAAGTLILEDAHTVLATFDPLKLFGPSTFGPFRLRALAPDSTPGPWLALATIIRLPTLTALHCSLDATLPCTLSGTNLYLIDSISSNPTFATPTPIPQDLVDPTLTVPHGPLYLRLRDDPTPIHQLLLPIQTDPPLKRVPQVQAQ